MNTFARKRTRYLSSFIDGVLLLSIVFFYIYSFGDEVEEGKWRVEGSAILPIPLFWLLYLVVPEVLTRKTVGKKLTGLTVVREDGSPVTFVDSFLRHLFDPVDGMFVGILSLIVMARTEKHQRLGDVVAHTVVIKVQIVQCHQCREQLELSLTEIERGYFHCPACQARGEVI